MQSGGATFGVRSLGFWILPFGPGEPESEGIRSPLCRGNTGRYLARVSADEQLTIRAGRTPGTFVLRGEIDMHTAPLVTRLKPSTERPRVVLDLSGVTFVDSAGVRALLELAATLRVGTLTLSCPSPPVRRVLDLIQADALPNVIVEG